MAPRNTSTKHHQHQATPSNISTAATPAPSTASTTATPAPGNTEQHQHHSNTSTTATPAPGKTQQHRAPSDTSTKATPVSPATGNTASGGAKARSGLRLAMQVAARAGAMKSRGVPAPAHSTKKQHERSRGEGGPNTVGSPADGRHHQARSGHRSLIERKVVSGHAYAILAPETAACGGWCGYDNPTFRR